MRRRVATASPKSIAEHSWVPEGHAPFAGKYTVERILGEGGMGIVFEARHIRIGQRVAIKVLGSTLRDFPELVERFEREARACGSLSSAHAVRVFDIDATEDGTPFIVMELLAGRDLGQIIERDGPQSVSRSVRWVIEACDAISEAHRLGIIHRDIKPSNLFLTDVEGRSIVKVLDFGIAKHVAAQGASITQAVCPLGTPQYMSPEQVRCSKDVDGRTDVWSLGVTLYELVTGQTPFPHDSSSACIAAIAADPVPDPRWLKHDLPDAFVDVLMRALEKNASDRYQTVEELVSAIAPFARAVDDDELTVSAVRRAIASIPSPAARASEETAFAVAGDGAALEKRCEASFTPIADGASYAVRRFEPRAPQESRPDRTAPPAISLARMPAKPRRFKSTVALASAAALGLAALVLAPRFAATTPDAARNALHATASLAAQPVVPAEDLDVAARLTADAPPPSAPPVTVDTPAAAAATVVSIAPVAPRPLVARPLVPGLASAAPEPRAGTHAKSDKPLQQQATAFRSVHGGLSNPGF